MIDMLESLRRCATCSHIRSSHPGGSHCAGVDYDAGDTIHRRCQCPGFTPGEQSSEGLRAEGAALLASRAGR